MGAKARKSNRNRKLFLIRILTILLDVVPYTICLTYAQVRLAKIQNDRQYSKNRAN